MDATCDNEQEREEPLLPLVLKTLTLLTLALLFEWLWLPRTAFSSVHARLGRLVVDLIDPAACCTYQAWSHSMHWHSLPVQSSLRLQAAWFNAQRA
jgi:hypothetical protein